MPIETNIKESPLYIQSLYTRIQLLKQIAKIYLVMICQCTRINDQHTYIHTTVQTMMTFSMMNKPILAAAVVSNPSY